MSKRRKSWRPTLIKKEIVVSGNLLEFLEEPLNTTSREVALRWRFLYDLSVAAANAGYALQTFLPDVDREGIDVVLSDADETRPIQLKATTKKVDQKFVIDKIHCGALRPNHDIAEHIGFQPGQSGTGQHGCIVLTEIFNVNVNDACLDVRYWITDAYILAALSRSEGLVPGAPPEAQQDALALIEVLQQGTNHDRVNVRGSCFIPAASPGALLALAGFHSRVPSSAWQYNLAELMRFRTAEEDAQLEVPGFITAKEARKKWDNARGEQVKNAFIECVKWPEASGSGKS